jgi:hypothetical protein
MTVQVQTRPAAANASRLATADCDIHPQRSSNAELLVASTDVVEFGSL